MVKITSIRIERQIVGKCLIKIAKNDTPPVSMYAFRLMYCKQL